MTPPKVFISYSHDSTEHEDAVLTLSNRLRHDGVDCVIDQYEESPENGWPWWCDKQVQLAGFVVVICTPTYLKRFMKEEEPGKGLGATWEGHVITQELYNAQGKNTKFIPLILSREDSASIPMTLQSATRYQLPRDYELFYRRLTGQPAVVKPPVGGLVAKAERLPPQQKLERKEEFAPVWHVPHRRSDGFTGRETALIDLREALERRGIAALFGLGGMGKTQTATEYAWRYRAQYKAVFWIDADSTETLRAGFVSVAAALGLASADARDQELAVAEVQTWLVQNPGWLLILDNADELLPVKRFVPAHGSGHVLLTTREHAVRAMAEGVPMRPMAQEEGALLLLRSAGVLRKEQTLAEAKEEDRRDALKLSEELGGLPLALDQAGAYILETPSTISRYLGVYATRAAKLLNQRGVLGEHKPVTVTFSLAFQKVAEKNPAAGDLIRFCAFLAPDAIPDEIFLAGDGSLLGEHLAAAAKSEGDFDEVIKDACKFSLVSRDAEKRTLSVHRLVQAVVRDGMPREDQRLWAERVIRVMNNAFPNVEFKNWALCQRLIVHSQSCASLAAEWSFDFAGVANLLNKAAYYLDDRALFTEAEPLYQHSLAVREKISGPEHPDVATGLNNLAVLYRKRGKYAEAESLYQRSLALRERVFGPNDPDVAASLNNLALLYRRQGRYAEAEPLYQRCCAIQERTLGPDHPDLATGLSNLALLYQSQDRDAEAEPLYQRSLAIRERVLGPYHPDVAISLNNIASFYDRRGKYGESEPLYQRSLTIFEGAQGPNHPDVATVLENLAKLYEAQGMLREATPFWERARSIREMHGD
ncbi:tetratricopeptide repeat protein [Granulicella sibirica]|uniref:SEFIR domain-containing protein n=1 Tax=Granulicella sibirica TaxID=2479048 RepID=A0A4V1L5S7_9BACT|nr:tetratricopeptide repeat protein [Granulicella sibirica]RXH56804.1 hypothetical protein GRAN_0114 [Granulicella sibirica]